MKKEDIILRVNYLKSLYGTYTIHEYDQFMKDAEEIDDLLEELEEKFSDS